MISKFGAYIGKYMWKHFSQYTECFYTLNLRERVEISSCGCIYEGSGDIFSESLVHIDNISYSGNTMIHATISDYQKWINSSSSNSSNISLHIIAIQSCNNPPIVYSPKHGTAFFCIIPETIFAKYFAISNSAGIICGEYFNRLSDISKLMYIENLFTERLEAKCNHLKQELQNNNFNWVDTLLFAIFDSYQIASHNRKLFINLLHKINYYMIIQSIESIEDMEALLLGASGLLKSGEYTDDYVYDLRTRFDLMAKSKILGSTLDGNKWNEGSMKGGSSISLAIAQLAAILFYRKSIFFDIIEKKTIKDIKSIFEVEVSPYWINHYSLGVSDKRSTKSKKLSSNKIDTILINGILPFIALYLKEVNFELNEGMDGIVSHYLRLEPESNKFITQWISSGIDFSSALETQSFIQLSKCYCSKQKCCDCYIGIAMLKNC